ncbi:MAG: hypothetical protein JW991_01475 [Candidatus Pacebacteria bacterium]|nr:hypothetical protein [Candidatus Paceibacterota bacterium]
MSEPQEQSLPGQGEAAGNRLEFDIAKLEGDPLNQAIGETVGQHAPGYERAVSLWGEQAREFKDPGDISTLEDFIISHEPSLGALELFAETTARIYKDESIGTGTGRIRTTHLRALLDARTGCQQGLARQIVDHYIDLRSRAAAEDSLRKESRERNRADAEKWRGFLPLFSHTNVVNKQEE